MRLSSELNISSLVDLRKHVVGKNDSTCPCHKALGELIFASKRRRTSSPRECGKGGRNGPLAQQFCCFVGCEATRVKAAYAASGPTPPSAPTARRTLLIKSGHASFARLWQTP